MLPLDVNRALALYLSLGCNRGLDRMSPDRQAVDLIREPSSSLRA